ncbi:MAG: hypothetical protein JJU11_10860 [Candidatus Sumerlaeia bacterium]|nr:hypothetical protein [Candidatus Sumerlaeia bacterium]
MHRILPCLLLLAASLLASCQRGPTAGNAVVYHFDADPGAVLYIGDVQDVLDGVVNEDGKVWRDASAARIGFGAGSPEGIESLGEFLSFKGVAYAKSTDPGSESYYDLIYGPRFLSTCSVFIPNDANPTARVTYTAAEGDEGMTLGEIYELLHEVAGHTAYCFSGSAHFHTLDALAVSRAPIYGEDLFGNRDRYYTKGATSENDVPTMIMGCAADFASITDEDRRAHLARILYDNPYDEGGELSVHAHALILHEHEAMMGAVGPGDVRDVNHLLSQSRIQAFDLEVFPIGELVPHP